MSEIPNEMNSEDFNLFLGNVDTKDLLLGELVDEVIPDAYDVVPSNENFSGHYNFDVLIPSSKSLVYSPKLEKLFIKMSNDFTVLFTWNFHTRFTRLFVRAKPRFSNSEDANKAVKRCLQHSHEGDHSNQDKNAPIRHHILRCKNTQALYEGGFDQHFSVCLPLTKPEVGTDSVAHTYQFVCQSSCASGMNRRPIEVIFTLEDECGEVHGRKSINVRICSCPKRDKEKEEAEVGEAPLGQPPPNKRRKTSKKMQAQLIEQDENKDTAVHTVTFKVVGSKGKKAALEGVYNILAGQMMLQPGHEDVYRPLLEDVKNQIHDFL
nr:cellular tumor antigen p53 [Onthophagus taurus]XP_022919306.1 cellular tumor antigen p53 [Onthophagus taurus]